MSESITTRSPEYLHYIDKKFTKRWKNSQGNKVGIWKILKAGQWSRQSCFVVGGGPSIKDFDFERLRGKGRIIAVNKAFLDIPFADVMIAMDPDLYTWIHDNQLGANQKGERVNSKQAFKQFTGIKLWIDNDNHRYNNIYYVYRLKDAGLSRNIGDHGGIFSGNNTGIGALMFACSMGCNPIYLLGFDLKHQGPGRPGKKASHYHGGYPNRVQKPKTVETFRHHFVRLAPMIKQAKIRVFNLSPISALKCFPKKSIDEVLNDETTIVSEDEDFKPDERTSSESRVQREISKGTQSVLDTGEKRKGETADARK